MYGIFTYIYHQNQPNVGKYTIHGSYGNKTLLKKTNPFESPYDQAQPSGSESHAFQDGDSNVVPVLFTRKNHRGTEMGWEMDGNGE